MAASNRWTVTASDDSYACFYGTRMRFRYLNVQKIDHAINNVYSRRGLCLQKGTEIEQQVFMKATY